MEWVRSSVPHTEESKGIVDEIRDATPSFALLDVQGPVIVTYVYQLVDGEVCLFLINPTRSPSLRTFPSQSLPPKVVRLTALSSSSRRLRPPYLPYR
jgi:hypothetical protein